MWGSVRCRRSRSPGRLTFLTPDRRDDCAMNQNKRTKGKRQPESGSEGSGSFIDIAVAFGVSRRGRSGDSNCESMKTEQEGWGAGLREESVDMGETGRGGEEANLEGGLDTQERGTANGPRSQRIL